MGTVILTLLLAGGQTSAKTIQRESQTFVRAQTPAQLYAAGIAAAAAKRWDVAAQRFREAIAGDATEHAGYFPHYWLGVAYDELHDTARAAAEWRESQRQRAIAGTPEEAAMKARMSAQMRSVVPPRPPVPQPVPKPVPTQPIHQPLPPPVPVTTVGVMRLDTVTTAPTGTTAPTSATATTSTMTAVTDTAAATDTTAAILEHHHDLSTPEGQLFNEIDQRFRALNPGQMLVNAPQTMRVGVAERFVLRIASAGQNAGIAADLSGPSTTSEIHVTPTMRATLAGNGFTIAPISPEEQFIGGGSFTEWSWQVTPTDSGDHELVVSVMVVLDGRVKAIPKVWPVHVSANVGLTLSHFFASYWQWIITALIIPLAGLFWRRRKKEA
jgi:hypothetical protein